MSKVYVVFCMDTEGPCDDPNNSELLKTWEDVNLAMDKLFKDDLRFSCPDSYGGNLKIGWFFLSWTGFTTNPRKRDMGYHKVRDHYIKRWGDLISKYGDEHCWHYHHPAKSKIGNEWGFDWKENNEYSNIISRQLLDRNWFPVCYRSGGTIHTNESSNWVDNWFPFDYSNRAPVKIEGIIDWSGAKDDWSLYKPDIFNFKKPGTGKRYIARTLDLMTGAYSINENEIKKAFELAQKGKPAILSVFDHDYRDISNRVMNYISLINEISKNYPEIKWQYASPTDAIIQSQQIDSFPKSIFVEAALHNNKLRIWTTSPIHQNIPWIALEDANEDIIHITENVIQDSPLSWEVDISNYNNYKKISIGVSTFNGLSSTYTIQSSDEIFSGFLNNDIYSHPIYPNSINDHSKLYPKLCIDRISGCVPEMDSIKQLCSILKNLNLNGCSLLDVGCAAGQLAESVREIDINYHGIDAFQRGIQLGKLILGQKGLEKSKLRNISLYQLNTKEKFDIVVNLFDFRYSPQFENYLEIMARIAKKFLIIRAPSFDSNYQKRYLPDILLENEFQTMRSFFNIYNEKEIESFLKFEGFKVTWIEDIRQKEKFKSKPEVVGGIEFFYKFLIAERIDESPSKNRILGKYWSKHASLWSNEKKGLPT